MMPITKRLVTLLMAGLVLAACSAPESIPGTGNEETPIGEATATESTPLTEMPAVPSGTPGAGASLEGTTWALDSFGVPGTETPVLEGTNVTLEFAQDGQAGGSGGCNTFGAQYKVEGNTLSFSDLLSTLMACTDEGVTEQEKQYIQALQTAGEFEQTGDILTIWFNDGQGVLNFTRNAAGGTPYPEPTSAAGQPTQAP